MKLKLLPSAEIDLDSLKSDRSKARILKDVVKTLNLMEANLRHPSLNTHEYQNFVGPNGEKVFGAYAQQNTSRAYRILWFYGPERNMISILAIVPHLD